MNHQHGNKAVDGGVDDFAVFEGRRIQGKRCQWPEKGSVIRAFRISSSAGMLTWVRDQNRDDPFDAQSLLVDRQNPSPSTGTVLDRKPKKRAGVGLRVCSPSHPSQEEDFDHLHRFQISAFLYA
jgi:hypothetical protein